LVEGKHGEDEIEPADYSNHICLKGNPRQSKTYTTQTECTVASEIEGGKASEHTSSLSQDDPRTAKRCG
jgi:hypothetical protein